MRNVQEIEKEEQTMSSIMQLTGAFEGIASMHIARLKEKVIKSEEFFSDLWPIYSQLRVGKEFTSGRRKTRRRNQKERQLLILITSEGSLSGDIDHRVVTQVLNDYEPGEQDILVLGHHGATQLAQRNVDFVASFKIPPEDVAINFDPVVDIVRKYDTTTVYYQSYITLMLQEVKKIELGAAIQELGDSVEENESYISDASYIFEPSNQAVIDYMERSMLYVALEQVILSSRLAQHASRFRAMTSAHAMAEESRDDIRLELNRTKRAIKDQRTREIINGLKKRAS